MNLLKTRLLAAIALGIVGGFTNALACTVTPDSILTEGQTLQLTADCGANLVKTINWKMAVGGNPAVTLTGDVDLAQAVAKKINYTIPVELASSGTSFYTFSVTGTYDDTTTFSTTDPAKVVVKPASTAIAVVQSTTTPVPGACGTTPGAAVQSMPAGTDQCSAGKAALAISGPTSFTWSCLGLNGGAEANCYAMRGYTVSATVGPNGSLVGISPVGGGVAAGGTATITVQPAANYSASFSSQCGGAQSGNTFTTGPVSGNCTVSATFSDTPVAGVCGSANGVTTNPVPSANLCSSGTASAVASGTAAYTWSCAGLNGGSTSSCSAPRSYTVNATAGANGSISPASREVNGNTTTTFTVTPNAGYMASVSGCGGALNGGTYSTAAITAACTVSATFSVITVSTTDPGIGAGLWVPPNMATRTVADQSGDATWKLSYVPGCLNGLTATSSSSGCAGQTSYTGTIAGTTSSRTVTMGSPNELVLRYKSTPTAGSSVKYIRTRSYDGGNVGVNMRVWLSADPTATYESAAAACKQTSSRTPMVITGPGYCPISPNTTYYYGMDYDITTGLRFSVDETGADFL
jgi:hypothetical protein